jgi:hypothetical protein
MSPFLRWQVSFSYLPKTKEKAIKPHADVLIVQDPKSFPSCQNTKIKKKRKQKNPIGWGSCWSIHQKKKKKKKP